MNVRKFLGLEVCLLAFLLLAGPSGISSTKPTQNGSLGDNPTPATITINYAGDFNERGGPWWQPPGESIKQWNHSVVEWREGYYTNDSKQSNPGIYINCSIISITPITDVWLNWLNETTWTNWTYPLHRVGGPFSPYWDIDTSTVIYDTCEGYRYSFDIVVNTSNPPHSSIAQWNKTALGSSQLPSGIHTYTRRYVQLNCKIESDITYKPYYLDLPDEKITPCIGHNIDASTMDRLHHDQGIGACQGGIDVGYLVPNTPGENMSCIHCTQSVCGWFDENVLLEDFTLTNIYAHVWWSSNLEYAPNLDSFFFGFSASRGIFLANHTLDTQKFRLYNFHNVSHITYHYPNYPWTYDHYSLSAGLLDINDYQFTTNNIYEFAFDVGAGSISVINNRSITSFIILNVPDNNTLNTTDWTSQGGHLGDRDGDGLSDWTELYVIYTNPFISDTDNDGISDNEEYQVHSDPNNYLDQNLCPEIPQNPTPPDFAHNVNVYSSLSWDPCGDPDGETVTYTVYLKARDPQFTSNDIVSENQTALSFNPGNDIPLPGFHMEGVTKYFWKIVAYDEHGAKSEGPVWCFKTAYAYEQYNRNILQE